MLSVFVPRPNGLISVEREPGAELPADAAWIDLREPTPDEEQLVEKALGIDVPTREEMREIEASNRFYEEEGSLYMTATLVTKLDTDLPERTQVTFILTGSKLVTQPLHRSTAVPPFRGLCGPAPRRWVLPAQRCWPACWRQSSIASRTCWKEVGSDVDAISSKIFFRSFDTSAPLDFRHVLERIGQSGDLVSKASESLVSLTRLLGFVQQSANTHVTQDSRARYRTLSRDVLAMSDHSTFLSNKVQFLLDATLGMVSIDQNNIVKIFSVVTVYLLPPSFIAGFFGMNFERLPLLHSSWGVSFCCALMLASAVLPYLYFKHRRWL